eukprot:850677-Prorocentrum_minimum.AAC.3
MDTATSRGTQSGTRRVRCSTTRFRMPSERSEIWPRGRGGGRGRAWMSASAPRLRSAAAVAAMAAMAAVAALRMGRAPVCSACCRSSLFSFFSFLRFSRRSSFSSSSSSSSDEALCADTPRIHQPEETPVRPRAGRARTPRSSRLRASRRPRPSPP